MRIWIPLPCFKELLDPSRPNLKVLLRNKSDELVCQRITAKETDVRGKVIL